MIMVLCGEWLRTMIYGLLEISRVERSLSEEMMQNVLTGKVVELDISNKKVYENF